MILSLKLFLNGGSSLNFGLFPPSFSIEEKTILNKGELSEVDFCHVNSLEFIFNGLFFDVQNTFIKQNKLGWAYLSSVKMGREWTQGGSPEMRTSADVSCCFWGRAPF